VKIVVKYAESIGQAYGGKPIGFGNGPKPRTDGKKGGVPTIEL
jgi:hypothetical protein